MVKDCQQRYNQSNYIKDWSWNLAAFQKDQIRPLDFRVRVSGVILLTIATFKGFRGLKRFPITYGAYCLYRNIITPELNEPKSRESVYIDNLVKSLKNKIGI